MHQIENKKSPTCYLLIQKISAFSKLVNTALYGVLRTKRYRKFQCPNCGRTYRECENVYYCGNCNYKLLRQENITKIKNPDLSKREYKIVGTIQDPTKPVVACPYCKSTNTSRISTTSKVVNIAIFGIFGTKRHKQWHCNSCGSDFLF